jgi:ABC-type multidrug transport system fused ATPase/permease subunit
MSHTKESAIFHTKNNDMEPYAITTAVSFALIGVVSLLGSHAESTLNPRFKESLADEVSLSHVVFNSTIIGSVVLLVIAVALVSFTRALYERSVCVFGRRHVFATSLALSSSVCGMLSLLSLRMFDPDTPHHLALAMTCAITGSTSMWLCADNDPYLSSCAFLSTMGIVFCAVAQKFSTSTIVLTGEIVIWVSVILYFTGVGLTGRRESSRCDDERVSSEGVS